MGGRWADGTGAVVTLWDARAHLAPAGLFVTGLLARAVFLQGLSLTAEAFGRLASVVLAAYVLLTAGLVASLPGLVELWQLLRLPPALYEQPPGAGSGRPRQHWPVWWWD